MTGNFSDFLTIQTAAAHLIDSIENDVLLFVYLGNQ